ncbi:hypothetical protein MBLNU230_g3882t1 [Neophaeotheca triangularis]
MASPTPSGSPVADFLTPRTKLARQLEAIDNAPTPTPKRHQSPTQKAQQPTKRTLDPFQEDSESETHDGPSHPSSKVASENGASSDDDSIRDAQRPRGAAARRMLGGRDDGSPTGRLSSQGKTRRLQHHETNADEQDELYNATPIRKRLAWRAVPSSPPGSGRSVRSGGLFVSPAKSTHNESDDELPDIRGSRLAELVAKNREKRLAREAEEKTRKERATSAHASSDAPGDEMESSQHVPDENAERILSDAVKPTRKASKKALLEMERETQRMSRQMALAHQMKVKRKFTLGDFAKRFEKPEQQPNETGSENATASSAPNSDGPEPAAKEPVSTPPSSPPTPLDRQRALVEHGALSKMKPVREDSLSNLKSIIDDDEDLPDLAQILSSSRKQKPEVEEAPAAAPEKKEPKLGKLGRKPRKPIHLDSDDDDLEIIQPMPRHLRAFDNIRPVSAKVSEDNKAIHNLKHLSHIGAYVSKPSKRGVKPSIGASVLEAQLRRKAKEQARKQQQERLEELKAKGIVVQTAEERERAAEEYEDLLEKARREATDLRKAEKAAAKEAGVEGAAAVSSDEDEDEDYVGSGDDDEEMGGAEDGEGLVDEIAEESDEEEGEEEEDDDREEEFTKEIQPANGEHEAAGDETIRPMTRPEDATIRTPAPRKSRTSRVVKDDEDNNDLEIDHAEIAEAPIVAADDEDPFAAFNFGNGSNDALMSPTQAFHATMQTPTQDIQEDSMALYRQLPPPSTSSLPPTMPEQSFGDTQNESQGSVVSGSQAPESQRIDLTWQTQAPETPAPALNRGPSALSETPGWEPTQDQGIHSPWPAPLEIRRESTLDPVPEEEHETQSTVPLRVSESPRPASDKVRKRGRLSRHKAIAADESDEEEEAPQAAKQSDAFREMARRRKEALTAAERAEAAKEMKGMLEEQAEESEDEYAGLGGDDFVAPETEQDKEMIDSGHVDVDENALAAHFAERQRQADEAETSRLYKDLTTGALRRKQANAFDLDEDEDDIAVRRRQMRQREEARKRKLLLQDENLAGLAEGKGSKGKDAFLKAIADDDGDDELIGLSDVEDDAGTAPLTQDESQPTQERNAPMPLQESNGNKRRLSTEEASQSQSQPPTKQRRSNQTANSLTRPTSLNQIQESLSFLLEEPHPAELAGPTALDASSDVASDSESEDGKAYNAAGAHELETSVLETEDAAAVDDEANRANDGGFAPDRAMMPPPRAPASARRTPAARASVVDRLSLRRGASSNSSNSSSHGKASAWAASTPTTSRAVPSLLRRATTSSTAINDRGVSTSNGSSLRREATADGGGSGVKKSSGGGKSSLAYAARAEERRGILEAGTRRRREETERMARLRRGEGGMAGGLRGVGKFE